MDLSLFDRRAANLDRRLLVLTLLAVLVGVFAAGEYLSPYRYDDPRFVIDYFTTELVALAVLLAATMAFFPPARLGLRPPRADRLKGAWPLAVLMLVTFIAWASVRQSVPTTVVVDPSRIWAVLRTTILVGINEEWIFRGLLPAALCRWLGLRRGLFVSLLAFGAFHLLNLIAGVPPAAAAIQVLNTIVLGAVFMVGALATRSLLLPMIAHALYDLAVIDASILIQAGANGLPMAAVPAVGLLMGLWCLIRIARWPGEEPYG